jgi:5-formaminoimidazole-4-carboxamide-1-(beta)-D-ribofuranosyl 5'-monophosphate synthetase
MISRKEMQKTAGDYKTVSVGVLGSHSAEEVGMAAKAAGLRCVCVVQKGRDALYAKHSRHLFDEVITLDDFKELSTEKVQSKLRELGVVWIPNRSFSVYVGYDSVEDDFRVPMYGNRALLRSEERNAPKSQYWLLEKARVRAPRRFDSPSQIDRLAIVKVQQKARPIERAFFYASSAKDFDEQADALVKRGVIDRAGLDKARIEEFVIGPRFNANFHAYALAELGGLDFCGFEDRIQTDLKGLLNLPARDQLKLDVMPRNEEVGHFGVTMRESLKPLVYDAAEKFADACRKEFEPGLIGLFSLQGALPYGDSGKPEFVVFDVSPRIPGCPCVGPTSPEMRRLSLKHRQPVESPLDLSMLEVKYAAERGKLGEVVT